MHGVSASQGHSGSGGAVLATKIYIQKRGEGRAKRGVGRKIWGLCLSSPSSPRALRCVFFSYFDFCLTKHQAATPVDVIVGDAAQLKVNRSRGDSWRPIRTPGTVGTRTSRSDRGRRTFARLASPLLFSLPLVHVMKLQKIQI
mmetsp:Transcript_42619/g.68542  ORF Transcript_42619/g.68542 Transcript_42619/m.68542 type:complete len:143 (-) Transcript_42619:8-436(-)